MNWRFLLLAVAVVMVALPASGCRSEGGAVPATVPVPTPVTPVPAVTPAESPTAVPAPSATAKPTSAPTSVATSTPRPTPRPTAAPTPTSRPMPPTATLPPTAVPAPSKRDYTLANTLTYQVTLINSVLNKGSRPIRDVESALVLPVDTPSQTVLKVASYPEPAAYFTDSWGNRGAQYRLGQLGASAETKVKWTALVEVSDIKYDVNPANAGTLAQIPEDIRNVYTRDEKYYRLKSATVQRAARTAVGREKNLYGMVRAIHDYVVRSLTYYEDRWDRIDWDAADATLIQRSGVCTEYAFVFIALCRANGIPARFYTGTWRDGVGPVVDDRFHRAAEVYFPNHGWVPVDPTLDDLEPKDKYAYFLAARNDVLTLITAGGESEYLWWSYQSLNHWGLGARAADIQVYRSAEWRPG